MADIISGNIGPEAKYSVSIVNGKLRIESKYDGAGVDAGVFIEVSMDYVLDIIADKIPGQLDNTIISLIKLAIKAA